jgi:hypothetical protein
MRVLGELSEGAVIVPDVVDILVLPDEVIAPDVIVPDPTDKDAPDKAPDADIVPDFTFLMSSREFQNFEREAPTT